MISYLKCYCIYASHNLLLIINIIYCCSLLPVFLAQFIHRPSLHQCTNEHCSFILPNMNIICQHLRTYTRICMYMYFVNFMHTSCAMYTHIDCCKITKYISNCNTILIKLASTVLACIWFSYFSNVPMISSPTLIRPGWLSNIRFIPNMGSLVLMSRSSLVLNRVFSGWAFLLGTPVCGLTLGNLHRPQNFSQNSATSPICSCRHLS